MGYGDSGNATTSGSGTDIAFGNMIKSLVYF